MIWFFVGGFFGILLTSLLAINNYNKGYKDGYRKGLKEAIREWRGNR